MLQERWVQMRSKPRQAMTFDHPTIQRHAPRGTEPAIVWDVVPGVGESRDGVIALATALEFAQQRLGTASAELVELPESRALLLSRIREGASPEDAVLWLLHQCAGDQRLGEEFIRYFLAALQRRGSGRLAPAVRQLLETRDLVQSVVGDLWPGLAKVEFRSADEFVALLTQRLHWKASDYARRLQRDRRSEDLRVEIDPDDFPSDEKTGPQEVVLAREEWARLQEAANSLGERDRNLIWMRVEGATTGEIAQRLRLSPEAAKKALQRAVQRARRARGASTEE